MERYAWKGRVKGDIAEYKRRHDALIVARGDEIKEGPESNFTIWYGDGHIFGYCELVKAFDHEPTPEEHASTVAWETRQLEIMDWLTDDMNWLTGENHPDNTTFNMDIPTNKFIRGDIYYEITYLSGSGCFTGWTSDTVIEGLETYVAGQLKEGAYSASLMVGTPVSEEVVPEVIPDHQLQNPPVYIIKAKDMMITNANQMKYEKEDGYVHFIPTGGDPNFLLFNNQTGSRYAVVKYRTEYQANIQIFLGSEGSGPKDDTTMLEQALIADGQWHLAIFDTQTLVDRGVYDGTTAAFLRLDVMESGYVLDENGEPTKDANGAWLKLPLPEGSTIDIAYFAFFETEEKINKFEYAPVVTDKTVYNVGEPIMITATGADKDWVGIAAADAAETLRWWYVADVGEGVAINALDNAAIQAGTGDATGNLPAGDYYVVWVPNDQSMNGAQGLCRYPITIVDPNAEPETPDEPEYYDNLVVPQDQWVISGHNTQLNDTTNPMVAAGGVESAALLHQGSIALGEVDLSKYSKVVVMWGCDNSQVTIDHYNANANNRIMLLNAVMDGVMSPAEETIIAGGTYELGGWAVQAFEIDLTGVDYNGPVYVAIDALPGTFALFASVEFIGAEIPQPEPVEDYNVPQDQWTVSGHCPQIVGASGHANSPMVAAGGIESGALLHQGSVGVGEIDLSKYSKVIVKYGIDGTQVTIDKHTANGTNRIMLSKADNHMTNAPAEADVIASVDYTPSGWALTAIEIDLTAVDYNGPVFITYDTLPGTFMLIGSIEFIA